MPTTFRVLLAVAIALSVGARCWAAPDDSAEPTTTAAAIAVVDVEKLPRINPKTVLEQSSTQLHYLAKAGIGSADAFYKETLDDEGWKSARTDDNVAAEYVDRLFTKDGYYLRLNIGASGDKGIVSISISNLGNVDVRKFPRQENAKWNEGSGPANATYFTKATIDDSLKFCRQEFATLGWKEYKDRDFDVPHVKMLYFRKNDVQIHAVVHREPDKLAEGPTSVSVMAMPVFAESPKAKPPVAAVAKNAPKRNPAAEADDPPPARKPAAVADDDDDDDFATKLQKEIEAKVNKELEKLGKDLGDVPNVKIPNVKIPGVKANAKGSSKSTTKPARNTDDDGDDDDAKPAPKQAPAAYFLTGTCKGTITFDKKKFDLKHAVAVRYQEDDRITTKVFCGGKPLKVEKLQKMKPDEVSLFDVSGFDAPPRLSLRFSEGNVSFTMFAEGASINVSSTDIKCNIDLKDDRLAGTARLEKPGDFFDKDYTFEVAVDLKQEAATATSAKTAPSADEVTASEDYDLPVPDDRGNILDEKSPYRRQITVTANAGVEPLVRFYRKQMTDRKFTENTKAAKISKTSAELSFNGPDGDVIIKLKAEGEQTQSELFSRNVSLATKHGIAPKNGMARIILGNASTSAAMVTIDGKANKVAAGLGADDPKDALRLDLKPGKHTIVVKTDGGSKTEEIDIPAGATWGVVVLPEGLFAERLF